MQETRIWSLGQKDPLEKEMATHSSILAWKIPWTEEPGGLQSMGSRRVGHDIVTKSALPPALPPSLTHTHRCPLMEMTHTEIHKPLTTPPPVPQPSAERPLPERQCGGVRLGTQALATHDTGWFGGNYLTLLSFAFSDVKGDNKRPLTVIQHRLNGVECLVLCPVHNKYSINSNYDLFPCFFMSTVVLLLYIFSCCCCCWFPVDMSGCW